MWVPTKVGHILQIDIVGNDEQCATAATSPDSSEKPSPEYITNYKILCGEACNG